MTRTTTYPVAGMVCGHCAGTLTEELDRVAGVLHVTVDLQAGTVTLTSDDPLPTEDVRTAVEEAGYALGAPCTS
ncbi:heavy-metal-associated domain-containing protein [Streptomyces sp. NPDC127068]|uniref:heavy-metal-associated domain-containing protein n=1 Tax=Streptomyces sp. NPDC127068 TaxID=3347127 RepID=UPI0036569AEB